MVLQQASAKACLVFGMLGSGGRPQPSAALSNDTSFVPYQVDAEVSADRSWKACLQPGAAGSDHALTATCLMGCTNSTDAVIEHVTYG